MVFMHVLYFGDHGEVSGVRGCNLMLKKQVGNVDVGSFHELGVVYDVQFVEHVLS